MRRSSSATKAARNNTESVPLGGLPEVQCHVALDDKLNDRLTLVGPGTPAGELLRRHWMPVAVAAELVQEPVKRVRILGEDLALFRADDGGFGLVGARCPHRGASLGYGFPDGGGLRCPYHGWLFGSDGTCLEQPNQHPDSERLRARSAIKGYPVRELGGLLFAYLGPGEPPELPVWDLLGREETQEAGASFRDIGYAVIPCNWLQIMENSFDPTHVEWLHGRYFNYQLERRGEPPTVLSGHHIKIGFDLVDYGIIKRRLREGQTEADEDWRVGHPVVFPNLLKVGGRRSARSRSGCRWTTPAPCTSGTAGMTCPLPMLTSCSRSATSTGTTRCDCRTPTDRS